MNDWKRILIVFLGVPLLLAIGFGIREAINSGGEKNATLYNTAIQTTGAEQFNYAVDSRQGRILGSGEFTPTQKVKFPEMSKEFAYVEKTKYEYTMHTRENCSTDSEGNETCTTETYYEWDYAGSDEVISPAFKFHGREYPSSIFSLGNYKHSAEACDFTPGNTGGWFTKNGCDGSYWYTDSNTRYAYDVIDNSFTAAFIANVSDGSLQPFKGNSISLENKSQAQLVSDANNYHLPGTLFIVFWFILVLGGLGTLAYAWALNDGVFE